MSGRCSWVCCNRPPDGKGWWCAEHAARLATAQSSTRPTLDAEPGGGEQ